MTTVLLGDVVELRAGVGFPPRLQGRDAGDYPMAKVGDISRVGRSHESTITSADHFVDAADLTTLRMRPVPAGAVLFAKIGEAMRHNHRVVSGRPMLIDNNAMAAIPNSQELDHRYLFRFLETVDFYALASSTTVPSLRKSDLARIELPLPTLLEQHRIAAILDHADGLRAKRRQVLTHLDSVTQAVFHDMFGEAPAVTPMSTVVEEFRYGTSNKSGDAGYPALRIPNIIGGAIDTGEIKTVAVEPAELRRLTLREGDLLFVRTNGNQNNVGRSAIFSEAAVESAGFENRPWIYASYLIRARLSEEIEPRFVAAYLASPEGREQLRERSKTSAGQYNINTEALGSIRLPAPSLAAQQEFAGRVCVIEEKRNQISSAGLVDDELFTSLQSRAFREEL